MDRVDGPLKVTGGARSSAESPTANIAHAVIVQSTVATGRVVSIAAAEAERMPGVLTVMTHRNAPRLPAQQPNPPARRVLTLLQDDVVRYNGQPIAVVVADTLEHATDAAHHVHATYASAPPVIAMDAARGGRYQPTSSMGRTPDSSVGDVAGGVGRAGVGIEKTY